MIGMSLLIVKSGRRSLTYLKLEETPLAAIGIDVGERLYLLSLLHSESRQAFRTQFALRPGCLM